MSPRPCPKCGLLHEGRCQPEWVEREARQRRELFGNALDAVLAEREFPNLERVLDEAEKSAPEQWAKSWAAVIDAANASRNANRPPE